MSWIGGCSCRNKRSICPVISGRGATGATGLSGSAGPASLPVNLTNFVDPVFGNNATAIPNDEARPYRTIGAAFAAAVPGTVVYVRPGVYVNETFILQDAVSFYFELGSILRVNSGTVFRDGGLPVVSDIQGDGRFEVTGFPLISLTSSGTDVRLKGLDAIAVDSLPTVFDADTSSLFVEFQTLLATTDGSPGSSVFSVGEGRLEGRFALIQVINGVVGPGTAQSDVFFVNHAVGNSFVNIVAQTMRAQDLELGSVIHVPASTTDARFLLGIQLLNATNSVIFDSTPAAAGAMTLSLARIVGGHPTRGAFLQNGSGVLNLSSDAFVSTSTGTHAFQIDGLGDSVFQVAYFQSDGGLLSTGTTVTTLRVFTSYLGSLIIPGLTSFPSIVVRSGVVSVWTQVYIDSVDPTTWSLQAGPSPALGAGAVLIFRSGAILGSAFLSGGPPTVQNLAQTLSGGQIRMIVDVAALSGRILDVDTNSLCYFQGGQIFLFFAGLPAGLSAVETRSQLSMTVDQLNVQNLNGGAVIDVQAGGTGGFTITNIGADTGGATQLGSNIVRIQSGSGGPQFDVANMSMSDSPAGNVVYRSFGGDSRIRLGLISGGSNGSDVIVLTGDSRLVGIIDEISTVGSSTGFGIQILDDATASLSVRNIRTAFNSALHHNSTNQVILFANQINSDQAPATIFVDSANSSNTLVLSQSITTNGGDYAVQVQGNANFSLRVQTINANNVNIAAVLTNSTGTCDFNLDNVRTFSPGSGVVLLALQGITNIFAYTISANNASNDAIAYLINGTATLNATIDTVTSSGPCLSVSSSGEVEWLGGNANTTNGIDPVIIVVKTATNGSYRFGGRMLTTSPNVIDFVGGFSPATTRLAPSTLLSSTNCITSDAPGTLTIITENCLANTVPIPGITWVPTVAAYSPFGLIVVDPAVA